MKKNLVISLIIAILFVVLGGFGSELFAKEIKGRSWVYTIKKGDTLSCLAKKWTTSVDLIMQANPYIKNRDLIYAGRTMTVPATKIKSAAVKKARTAKSAVVAEKIKAQNQLNQLKNENMVLKARENAAKLELAQAKVDLESAKRKNEAQISKSTADYNRWMADRIAASEAARINMRNLAIALGVLLLLMIIAAIVFFRALTSPLRSVGLTYTRGDQESTFVILHGRRPDI